MREGEEGDDGVNRHVGVLRLWRLSGRGLKLVGGEGLRILENRDRDHSVGIGCGGGGGRSGDRIVIDGRRPILYLYNFVRPTGRGNVSLCLLCVHSIVAYEGYTHRLTGKLVSARVYL
jgi:hypothetical protein